MRKEKLQELINEGFEPSSLELSAKKLRETQRKLKLASKEAADVSPIEILPLDHTPEERQALLSGSPGSAVAAVAAVAGVDLVRVRPLPGHHHNHKREESLEAVDQWRVIMDVLVSLDVFRVPGSHPLNDVRVLVLDKFLFLLVSHVVGSHSARR